MPIDLRIPLADDRLVELSRPIDASLRSRAGSGVIAAGAILAVVTVAADRWWPLWSAGAPWVAAVFQDAGVSLSEGALLALALVAFVVPTKAGQPGQDRRTRLAIAGLAGVGLLVAMVASAFAAPAPILTVARIGDVAIGLLAGLAIARRPPVARWVGLGFLMVVLLQLPFVVLQEATQSTFPTQHLLSGGAAETPVTAPGAWVVNRADGSRVQRALGTFPHPNVLGGFLALALVLALPHLSTKRRVDWLWLGVWGIGWVELALSFSRAAVLAAVVGSAIILAVRLAHSATAQRHRGGLAVLALVAVGSIAGLSRPLLVGAADTFDEPAIAQRVVLVDVAVDLIRTHPWRGVGAGNFSLAELQPPYNAVMVDPVHVVPLLVAAETGVPGGLLWLALVVGPLVATWRARGTPAAESGRRLAVASSLLILALLDHYLWTLAPGRTLFWLALGTGVIR